jgi:hypothetical protein
MRLSNNRWVAQEGGDDDPNDSTDILVCGKLAARLLMKALADVLRQVDNYHKQAREAIANWFANAGKAKVNKTGSTEPARRINDNTVSRTPGPHPDRFIADPKGHLEFLQRERTKTEQQIALYKQVEDETKLVLSSRQQLTSLTK